MCAYGRRMSLSAPYVFITLARQLNVVRCVIYYTAPSLSRTTPREFDIHASVRVQCVFIYLYVYDRSLARAARCALAFTGNERKARKSENTYIRTSSSILSVSRGGSAAQHYSHHITASAAEQQQQQTASRIIVIMRCCVRCATTNTSTSPNERINKSTREQFLYIIIFFSFLFFYGSVVRCRRRFCACVCVSVCIEIEHDCV